MNSKNKGDANPMWGKHHTAETKLKISLANKNHKHSTEQKLLWSINRRGINSYMYGTHLSQERRQKISIAQTGKKLTSEHRLILSEVNKNKIMSVETRKKISDAMKGKKHALGAKRSLKTLLLMKKNRALLKTPFRDTKPEKIVQQIIRKLHMPFEKHRQDIFGYPDIFIIPNICIFVDGCYFHSCLKCYPDRHKLTFIQKKSLKRDPLVNQVLLDHDYKILRIREHDLNTNLQFVIKLITDFIFKIHFSETDH